MISTPAGQLPRVLELGEGADQRQVGADAAVEALDRRQVESRPLPVEVAPAVLEADVQRSLPGPPDGAPERRARRLQADREERQARLDHRVDVGDQGRQRHAGLLGGQRRRQGEDVADDACGRISSSSGSSARAASAAWSPSAESGSGGGNIRYSSAAAKPSPAPSTASRRSSQVSIIDLVAAPAQRPSQRDRREDVPGIAEGGDEEAQACAAVAACAV